MMTRFDAAIFDYDGTIMDTGPGIIRCAQEVAREMDFTPVSEQEMRRFIGPPLIQCFQVVYKVSLEEAEKAAARYRALYDETDAIQEASTYPGIRTLLKDLDDAGIECAIASSKRIPLLNRMLDHYDLRPLFKVVEGASEEARKSNKAALIEEVLSALGLQKECAVMIGDSVYDAQAAKEAKVAFCGVLWGYGFDSTQQVQDAYPGSYVVQTVQDLQRLLLGE